MTRNHKQASPAAKSPYLGHTTVHCLGPRSWPQVSSRLRPSKAPPSNPPASRRGSVKLNSQVCRGGHPCGAASSGRVAWKCSQPHRRRRRLAMQHGAADRHRAQPGRRRPLPPLSRTQGRTRQKVSTSQSSTTIDAKNASGRTAPTSRPPSSSAEQAHRCFRHALARSDAPRYVTSPSSGANGQVCSAGIASTK